MTMHWSKRRGGVAILVGSAVLMALFALGWFGDILIPGLAASRAELALPDRPLAEIPYPTSGPSAFRSIQIDAPPPDYPQEDLDAMILTVRPDGSVECQGEAMDLTQLRDTLKNELDALEGDLAVTILPDADCTFRQIRQVMDLCEACDVRRFRVARQALPGKDSARVLNNQGV